MLAIAAKLGGLTRKGQAVAFFAYVKENTSDLEFIFATLGDGHSAVVEKSLEDGIAFHTESFAELSEGNDDELLANLELAKTCCTRAGTLIALSVQIPRVAGRKK